MKHREWIGYVAAAVVVGICLSGCGGVRKLAKSDPEVGLKLPAKSAPVTPDPVPAADTARPRNQIITFRKQDGTELYLTPMEVDTATGQKMISLAIDEVVISASSRRNLVERNGKINVEFVVLVPETFQNKAWRLQLHPQMLKGSDTVSLDPLVYSGEKFRALQAKDYDRYGNYRGRIVDSAEFFEHFGNKRAYRKYMQRVAAGRQKFSADDELLNALTPKEAMTDGRVGWMTPGEYKRYTEQLRRYAERTDRFVAKNTPYKRNPENEFDHLEDYLAPRYRYDVKDPLPGGEIFTRVDGRYPDWMDQQREAYFQAAAVHSDSLRDEVFRADPVVVRELAIQRRDYTGRRQPEADRVIRELGDSAVIENYRLRKNETEEVLSKLNSLDTAAVKQSVLSERKLNRNRMLEERSGDEFARIVRYPYLNDPRLDTVIYKVDGSVQYHYTELVQADENTSKLYLYLVGKVEDTSGDTYVLPKSDTLTYSVASMSTFVDETPRYMQRIITRDAESNARFFFTFPSGKSELDEKDSENRSQILAVKDLTRRLMTDPIYIIDSITLRATASPEGSWSINERLARERAEVLRRVLVSEFKSLYDSLKVSANYTLDDQGRVVVEHADDGLPDLPHLLRTKWLAEDWDQLRRLVAADTVIRDKEGLLAMIDAGGNPDNREWKIRAKYPQAYERMRKVLYPQMRAVDFSFNLHRRGMQQDTVYTTEIDSNYMHGVELLKKRRYEPALKILREYDDRNTALAYLSLGYDAAAYRILRADPTGDQVADVQYMLAILASRLGEEENAVQYYLRSVELRQNLKFRGNLDPEISRLIRKYGLFKEDFQ